MPENHVCGWVQTPTSNTSGSGRVAVEYGTYAICFFAFGLMCRFSESLV